MAATRTGSRIGARTRTDGMQTGSSCGVGAQERTEECSLPQRHARAARCWRRPDRESTPRRSGGLLAPQCLHRIEAATRLAGK